MPVEPDAAAAAAQAAADIALWKGIGYGALVSAVLFVLDKVFGDYWYALSFYRPKHQQKLAGIGMRIYGLTGKSNADGAEKEEPLASMFPEPGVTDGFKYEITNVNLRTKRNNDALLTCELSWNAKGKEWKGTLFGKGRFFPKADPNSFVGYVYLVCDGHARSGVAEETWKVTYTLRTKPTFDGWDGFWVMIDSYDSAKAKFGRIDLAKQ